MPNPAVGAFGAGRHRGEESPRLAGPWGEALRAVALGASSGRGRRRVGRLTIVAAEPHGVIPLGP
jgi:hypothetical protein